MKKKFFVGLVLLCLGIYITTAARTPVAYGDSDELIATGYNLAVPHPPGYPLQTFLVYFVTHLPIPGGIAFRAHLLAALFQALSVGLVFLISVAVGELIEKKKITSPDKLILFASGSLLLGLSFLFWLYANVLEVFPLNNFLSLLIIYLSILIYQAYDLKKEQIDKAAKARVKSWLLLLGLTLGLALAHQQISVLLILSVLILLIDTRIGRFFTAQGKLKWLSLVATLAASVFILVITFSLSYGLLFIIQSPNDPFSWQFDRSWPGIVNMISRSDFSGVIIEEGRVINAYWKSISLPESWRSLTYYLGTTVPRHFGWWGMGLIAIGGLVIALKTRWRLGFSLFSLFLLTGPLLAAYLIIPAGGSSPAEYYLLLATTERMYLLGYVIYGIFLSVGLASLFELIVRNKVFSFKRSPYWSLIVLILPLISGWQNYQGVNLSHYQAPYQVAQTVLSDLPQQTTLVCFSDLSCFSLLASQSIYQTRKDVKIVTSTPQIQTLHGQDQQTISRFHYEDNPYRIADVISWQVSLHKPVYVADIIPFYLNLLGMDGQAFYLYPGIGYVNQVDCAAPEISQTNPEETDWHKLNFNQVDQRNLYQMAFLATLTQHRANNGTIYARMGEKELARKELLAADLLVPNNRIITNQLKQLPNYPGNSRYLEKQPCLSAAQLIQQAVVCGQQGNQQCHFEKIFLATLVEPNSVQARILLAQEYYDHDFPSLAKREYQHVLLIDKDNPIALTQLEALDEAPPLQ